VIGLASALIIVGIKLRTETLAYHQNLWGIDWLTYYEAQGRALHSFNPFLWLFSWEGLHPPLSGIVHGSIQAAGGGLHIHWTATTAAGFIGAGALALEVWRRSGSLSLLLIIGVFSLSPLQSNYALNASPYPWTLLLLGLSSALLLRALERGGRRLWLASAIFSALATQAHVLVLAAVAVQALFLLFARGWKPRSWDLELRRWHLLVALSATLLVGGSLVKTTDPWTFHVGEEQPWIQTAIHMLRSRFGELASRLPLMGLLAAGTVGGLFTAQRRAVLLLACQGLAILAALGFFMETHVADPRLTHYYAPVHLLFLASGALGLGALARKLGPKAVALGFLLALGTAGPALTSATEWQDARNQRVAVAAQTETPQKVARLYSEAGDGDVIAYLWGHRFLNDEPEHFDPVAALWPTKRLGRPCFDIEAPRMQCNRDGNTYFYFDPRTHSSEFDQLEETLRLVINSASSPGRARLIILPSDDEPPRPWPVEPWFTEHGGQLEVLNQPTVLIWTFPPGLKIPTPPPLHPMGEDSSDSQDERKESPDRDDDDSASSH